MYRILKNTISGNERVQMLEHGKWRDVSAGQDLYQAWLAAGNTPEVVEFTPPPAPPAPTHRHYYDPQLLVRRFDKLGKADAFGAVLDAAPHRIRLLWETAACIAEDDPDFASMIGTVTQALSLTDEERAYILRQDEEI